LPHDSILPLIPHLRAFARSLAAANHDLADDVVQDTLMLALRHWDSFVPGTNLKAWLFRILHNRFYSLHRRRHVSAEVARDDLEALHWVPPAQDGALEVEAFRCAFRALSPMHREVLVLAGVHGLSCAEIAEICRCEIGTVKSRIHRARSELKVVLLGGADSPRQPVRSRRKRRPQLTGHPVA
jgi:RNA polymerase sigma-70 factor (ECF subfamily)